MKTMEGSSSGPSPPLSENAGGSWSNWEHELSSVSGLNLGSDLELRELVEDKEIAARAVAFVVNSTRKGIVPLCSDVANLLKAKRSLEKKVYLLKRDNEALRSSASLGFCTSHSTTPTSTHSFTDKSLLHDQTMHLQERSRPCSRCSQCSSTVSGSPKFEKTYSFKGQLPSPSVSRHARRRSSPRTPHRAIAMETGCCDPGEAVVLQRPPNGLSELARLPTDPLTTVLPGTPTSNGSTALGLSGLTTQAIVHRHGSTGQPHNGMLPDRKNSLPEIVSEPDRKLKRISSTISKETQCCIISHTETCLEEQFVETLRQNTKLTEDLGSAQREIENLRMRLEELEMQQNDMKRNQIRGDNDVQINSPDSPSAVSVGQKPRDSLRRGAVKSESSTAGQTTGPQVPALLQTDSPPSQPSPASFKQELAKEPMKEPTKEPGKGVAKESGKDSGKESVRESRKETKAEKVLIAVGRDSRRPDIDRQETCAAAKQKAQRHKRDLRIVNREPALV